MEDLQSGPMLEIVNWLKEKNPEIKNISPDANLLNEGILDSLQFVNFLFVIEQTRGEPIPEEHVIPTNFTTLQMIYNNFFVDKNEEPKNVC